MAIEAVDRPLALEKRALEEQGGRSIAFFHSQRMNSPMVT